MSGYNIALTDGTPLVTVADGTTDSKVSTSITLVGKNYAGYGLFINENFVQLLENFANSTEPPNALDGQIWWDTTNKLMKVRSGNTWKSVSGSTSSIAIPNNPINGDFWWDVSNTQLKVWGGSGWIVIGPSYTAATGQTGLSADVVAEAGGGQSHIVVKFYVSNEVVAVLSKDPSFTTTAIPGFSVINPGFNLPANNALGYYGNANNALQLGGQPASNYVRSDISGSINGSLTLGNAGLKVGANTDCNIAVTTTSVDVTSGILNKDLNFYVNFGNVITKVMSLSGSSGNVIVASSPTGSSSILQVATKGYVDSMTTGSTTPTLMKDGSNTITGNITPTSNDTLAFGSPSLKFKDVYATNFVGTSSNSLQLGGLNANTFITTTTISTTTIPDTGITIGANGDFTITSIPGAIKLKSLTAGKSLDLHVAGTASPAISIGSTGFATVIGNPTVPNGIANKQYVDNAVGAGSSLGSVVGHILPSANNTYDVGSTSMKWRAIYGVTVAATYADLAERFAADAVYAPGTVVEIGGSAEVTAVVYELSEKVFGVVSTAPAYLMHSDLGNNDICPPIALQGRVPVRVIGKVHKGDRLVSAGNGLARAAHRAEITSFNTIGRSLENKTDDAEGLVEAIVKAN